LVASLPFRAEMTEGELEAFRALHVAILFDASDDLQVWFQSHDLGAVLLRPDRYILGTAETPTDLTALLAFFEKEPMEFRK